MIPEFDDARLDDPQVLADHDEQLRHLAGAGARIRMAAMDARLPAEAIAQPRGVVVVGSEARLVRAVLEPVCPVPLVAWPLPGLPGWAGPLDLVVVLASAAEDHQSVAIGATVAEASRRGCAILLAAPEDVALSTSIGTRGTVRVPTRTEDATAAAVVVLSLLHEVGLGPVVHPEQAAEAADQVAELCTPHHDLSANPAKDLACGLGDSEPLIWGASVLAARASRRIAEAIRFYAGRHVLAADADEVAQVLRHVEPRDPFADPFTDDEQRRPVLVLLDDDLTDDVGRSQERRLRDLAARSGVRVCELQAQVGGDVDRYLTLLMHGLYGASYLGIGLGAEPGLVR